MACGGEKAGSIGAALPKVERGPRCSSPEAKLPGSLSKDDLEALRPLGIEVRDEGGRRCFTPTAESALGVSQRDAENQTYCERLLAGVDSQNAKEKCQALKGVIEGKASERVRKEVRQRLYVNTILERKHCSEAFGQAVIPKEGAFTDQDYLALVARTQVSPTKLHFSDAPGELCYQTMGPRADRRYAERLDKGCEAALGEIKSENAKEKCQELKAVVEMKAELTAWDTAKSVLFWVGSGAASLASLVFGFGYAVPKVQHRFVDAPLRALRFAAPPASGAPALARGALAARSIPLVASVARHPVAAAIIGGTILAGVAHLSGLDRHKNPVISVTSTNIFTWLDRFGIFSLRKAVAGLTR